MKNIQNLFNFIVIFVFGFSISGCVSYYANILPTESNIVTRHTKEADESKKQQEASEQQRRQVESIINQQLIKNKK